MPDSWFYLEEGKQIGPTDAAGLRRLATAGTLRPDTLVWKDGLAEWIPASRLNGLFSSTKSVPPPPPRPVSASAIPTPTSANEIVYPASRSATMSKVANAINLLGKVTEQNVQKQYIAGKIKYGLQSVKVRVSVVPVGQNQCRVVVQGSSDDVWGAGAKNVTRRLMETLRNLDNPGYKPDRLGIHPLALAGVVIGLFVLVILIVGGLNLVTGSDNHSHSTSSENSDTKPETTDDSGTSAAKHFMEEWARSGSASAEAALDPRAVDAVQNAVRTIKVKRFDGNVSDVGEGTVTKYATGDQYPVNDFDVAPVIDMGGAFVPMHIRISVAKDSGKVIAVVPQLDQ
jgi:hypothetical protein